MTYAKQISSELNVRESQAQAVLDLLAEKNTVPFIARYRKEKTGSLDEVQIRFIEDRASYLNELDERKKSVLSSIEEQGKLTPQLLAKINSCPSKTLLEDLYLPFKKKRKTKASVAKEQGLEPLAENIWQQPRDQDPHKLAEKFVSEEKGVLNIEAALQGARHIIAERIAEDADIRGKLRAFYEKNGQIYSTVKKEFKDKPSKYESYYDHKEAVSSIPSHRFLAIHRGEHEEVLRMSIEVDENAAKKIIAQMTLLNVSSPCAVELEKAIEDSFARLLSPSVETDTRIMLKQRSDLEAVKTFAHNLENLLLSAPMGARATIGIDPGQRTGCKCAVLSATGKFLESTTIYLTQGDTQFKKAIETLTKLVEKYDPYAIAVGNGTAGRETEAFVRKLLGDLKKKTIVVPVSESGASVYSASDIAREEFPDLDLTVRGAISIARRLQDPLAELVKVEPKSLGVGQYQHDVQQSLLEKKLSEVVESCVNRVGVDLNTASASLLAYVSGVGKNVAHNIVKYRDSNGAFLARKQLFAVAGLGPKSFEQAAGFLRILHAKNPLDSSAVHPERYEFVELLAKEMGVSISNLIGNADLSKNIRFEKYTSESLGLETLKDIFAELQKPGRDPRQTFIPPAFRDDVNSISDLKVGMRLEGVVTNVTAFGAFVDIGVHQDGLVHISMLSDSFVKDPHSVVKSGDKISVEVLEIDVQRKRISLSAKKNISAPKKVVPIQSKEIFSNPFAGLRLK